MSTVSFSVSTTSTGFSRRTLGSARVAKRASQKNSARSRRNAASTPGRSTLTATSAPASPSLAGTVARCTCAIEAAARGVSSKWSNNSSTGRPSPLTMVARASAAGNGGRRSRNRPRSSASSSPNRSARTESAWPSLMKLGPSACSAAARRSPGLSPGCARGRPASSLASAITTGGASSMSSGKSASWRARVRAMAISRRIWRKLPMPARLGQMRQAA